MKNIFDLKFVGLFCIVPLALTACQFRRDLKKEDRKFTYQYSVNGCDTGKRSFSDLASYCTGLLNDLENNYCAENERLQAYNQHCGSTPLEKQVPEEFQVQNEVLPRAESGSESEPFPPLTTENSAGTTGEKPGSSEAPLVPVQELVIVGHPEIPLAASTKTTGESISAILEGNLTVTAIEPPIERSLKFSEAKEKILLDEDLGTCELQVQDVKVSANKGALGFSIMGSDKKSPQEDSSCLKLFSRLATRGFTMEFKNVPVDEGTNEVLPKVTLKVVVK